LRSTALESATLKSVEIRGWRGTSLIDYPGSLCSVVFLAGCNFRCPYCHNPGLVKCDPGLPRYSAEGVCRRLMDRRGFIDGVCVSGGEPTLHEGLPDLLRRVRSLGLRIKLDTNGSRPEVLKALLESKLVDYVAMDVKAPAAKYSIVCGARVSSRAIEESASLLAESGVSYELRTTVAWTLLDEEDIVDIGEWLGGTGRYLLQPCRDGVHLDPEFRAGGIDRVRLEDLACLMRSYFPSVSIR